MKLFLLALLVAAANAYSYVNPSYRSGLRSDSQTILDFGRVQGSVAIGHTPAPHYELTPIDVIATNNCWKRSELLREFSDRAYLSVPVLDPFKAQYLGPYDVKSILGSAPKVSLHNFELTGLKQFKINDLVANYNPDSSFRLDVNFTLPQLHAKTHAEVDVKILFVTIPPLKFDVEVAISNLKINAVVAARRVIGGLNGERYLVTGLVAHADASNVQADLRLNPSIKVVVQTLLDAYSFKEITDEAVRIVGREVLDQINKALSDVPARALEGLIIEER